jgi:DNA-binding transcriptional ArsR family regulator
MEISLFDFNQYGMRMAELGVANYIKGLEPTADQLKQREVSRWLKQRGEKVSLSDLERMGLLNGRREGRAKNSPIFYSKADILAALNSIRLTKTQAQQNNRLPHDK